MARIRSVHPTLFTDERWVGCSPLARLLYIGLLTEADDQGLFEWKPIQIKIRLLALDNADVGDLLDELRDADLIAQLDSGGKRLGAVRKFRRFQRPKKPNSLFVLPPEWRTYVGLDDASGEPSADDDEEVPNQFRTSGELAEQKEDGGDKMEEGESSTPSATVAVREADVDAVWQATPKVGRERSGRKDVERALRAAAKRGHDPSAIREAIKAYYASDDATKQLGQFAKGCHRLIENDRWLEWARPAGAGPDPAMWERVQRVWCEDYRDKPFQWKTHERGPPPGKPGCRVSASIQREFGFTPAEAAA